MISRISGIDRYVRDLGAIVSPFRCSDVGLVRSALAWRRERVELRGVYSLHCGLPPASDL